MTNRCPGLRNGPAERQTDKRYSPPKTDIHARSMPPQARKTMRSSALWSSTYAASCYHLGRQSRLFAAASLLSFWIPSCKRQFGPSRNLHQHIRQVSRCTASTRRSWHQKVFCIVVIENLIGNPAVQFDLARSEDRQLDTPNIRQPQSS